MKKLPLALFLIFIFFFSSCIVIQDSAQQSAPAPPEYEDFRNWQSVSFIEKRDRREAPVRRVYNVNFDKIILDVPLRAEILPTRRQPRVEIIAPDKILKRLLVEENQNYLSLRFGAGSTFFRPQEAQLRIYVKKLQSLHTKREVFFPEEMIQPRLEIFTAHAVEGDLKVDHGHIETYDNGSFTGVIRAGQVQLIARDHTHIEVYGRTGQLQATAENNATIDGKGLNADNADLTTLQGAAMAFSVSYKARARAAGNAEIVLFKQGPLTTNFTKTGNGQIIVYE